MMAIQQIRIEWIFMIIKAFQNIVNDKNLERCTVIREENQLKNYIEKFCWNKKVNVCWAQTITKKNLKKKDERGNSKEKQKTKLVGKFSGEKHGSSLGHFPNMKWRHRTQQSINLSREIAFEPEKGFVRTKKSIYVATYNLIENYMPRNEAE